MRNLIDWLIKMEKMAKDVYEKSAEVFRADTYFSDFLKQLATDEVEHVELMEKGLECIMKSDFKAPVTLDAETMSKIEGPLVDLRQRVDLGTINKEELMDCMIEAEFSEWNPLFLYAVQFVCNNKKDCLDAAARVQRHARRLRKCIESMSDSQIFLERFKQLPMIWRDKVLIVDDDPLTVSLLKSIFELDKWSVETSLNGKDALARVENEYFDIIVSDIRMPEMDGLDFFTRSKKIWPDIGERFLFYSGAVSPEHIEFFEKNGIQYMHKPARVKEIRERVSQIAGKSD